MSGLNYNVEKSPNCPKGIKQSWIDPKLEIHLEHHRHILFEKRPFNVQGVYMKVIPVEKLKGLAMTSPLPLDLTRT